MADRVIENNDNSALNLVLVAILIIALVFTLFFLFGWRVPNAPTSVQEVTVPETQNNTQPAQPEGGDGGSINLEVPEEININNGTN